MSEQLTEVARDDKGNILWNRSYQFSRLSSEGETIVEGGIWYTVVSSVIRDGIVYTVLRRQR